MAKNPTRFTVRKVKCCYRNSLVAGNPITKSFEMFGIYDKGWEYDNFCCLSPFENVLKNKTQSRKFRERLFRLAEDARKAADEMNRLWESCGRPEMIKFNYWGDELQVEKTEAKCPWRRELV